MGQTLKTLFILFFVLAAAPCLWAQAETCTGADLDSSDMFPVTGFFAPSANDFAMTGSGCSELGNDFAICFVPTDSCTVTVTCGNDTGSNAVNVFNSSCSTSPASCSASQTEVGSDATVTGVSLTGGSPTCVVCEFSAGGLPEYSITETAGSCGALPVELISFSVE